MTRQINCIIVAAGSGLRFGSRKPKQFCDLAGRPLLMTTVERMRKALPDARLLLILNPLWVEPWLQMCREHSFSSPEIIHGGKSRLQSVVNALNAIHDSEDSISMVHDGARPLVNPRVVNAVVAAVAYGAQGAIPCIPLTDSIRQIASDGTSRAADRTAFRAVQTPQAFPTALLKQAYSMPLTPQMTDDASVMEAAGYTDIRIIDGDPQTIKITHASDLTLAEQLMRHDS